MPATGVTGQGRFLAFRRLYPDAGSTGF